MFDLLENRWPLFHHSLMPDPPMGDGEEEEEEPIDPPPPDPE